MMNRREARWRKTDFRESGKRMKKGGDERQERMQRDGCAEMSEEQRVTWIVHDTRRRHAEKVEGEREPEEREQWKLRWREERRKVVEEREQSDEKKREEGAESELSELSELSERGMSMWDDGREMREEVPIT